MQTPVVHAVVQQSDSTPHGTHYTTRTCDEDFSTAGIRTIMFVSLERPNPVTDRHHDLRRYDPAG
jgi:hypothetical protein